MRASWLVVALLVACPGLVSAQKEPAQAEAPPVAAPGAEGAGAPEQSAGEPAEKIVVRVERGLLSVEIDDAPVGEVLKRIAKEAGFGLEQEDPSLSMTKVSTRFSGVEIERGITRIFTLVGHKDYFLHYNDEGNITMVEVLRSATSPAPARATSRPSVKKTPQARPAVTPPTPPTTRRPATTRDKKAVQPRPEVIVPEEEVTPPGMEIAPFEGPGIPEEVPAGPGDEMMEEAPAAEPAAPYIPPAASPTYVPSK